jgi:hypothetical protein
MRAKYGRARFQAYGFATFLRDYRSQSRLLTLVWTASQPKSLHPPHGPRRDDLGPRTAASTAPSASAKSNLRQPPCHHPQFHAALPCNTKNAPCFRGSGELLLTN